MKPPYRIAELESWVRGVEEAMISATDRAEAAEAEIARRDAVAGEVVHLYREHNPCNGMKTDWVEIDSEQLASLKESTDPDTSEFRTLQDAASPAVVSDGALREVIRIWHLSDFPSPEVYSQMREALGAQPQKPVSLVGDAVVYEHVKSLAQYGTLPNGVKVTAEFAAGFNYRGEVDKIALDAANVKWEMNK